MKLIHLADLHFGKLLCGVNLAESGDQRRWCEQCLSIVEEEQPQAVIIAGDIYDRSLPAASARRLCSWFLTELSRRTTVMMIAGNHDAAETVGYLAELLEPQGLYVSGSIERELTHVTLEDAYGPVTFWLMPYFFPAKVMEALGLEETPATYTQAAKLLLERQSIDWSQRNVLVAHQMVVGGGREPERGGSETIEGGVGAIDREAFAGYDYVALGHIHRPQQMGEGMVYAGAPLCYHFDEAGKADEGNARRGILVAELGEKGTPVRLRRRETPPLHPLRNVTGKLKEILAGEGESAARSGEYVHVRLTDELVPPRARDMLEAYFEKKGSSLLLLDRRVTASGGGDLRRDAMEERSLDELFTAYYEAQYPDRPMTEAEQALVREAAALLEETRGGENDEDAAEKAAERLVSCALKQKEGEP